MSAVLKIVLNVVSAILEHAQVVFQDTTMSLQPSNAQLVLKQIALPALVWVVLYAKLDMLSVQT